MKDITVEAIEEVSKLERKNADAELQKMREELECIKADENALGVLQKINYDNAHDKLLKYAMLYQIRQRKDYKKQGMTWEQFCEAAGDNVRNVQRVLKDLRPIYNELHDKLSCFLDVPFNKIRYLGSSFSDKGSQIESNSLIIGGTKIVLTPDNSEEISTAIDTLIETHKKEKEDLKSKLEEQAAKFERQKKKTEKIIEAETETITAERDALLREVKRLKPYDIEDKDISATEDYIKEMHKLASEFEIAVIKFRKYIGDNRLEDDMRLQVEIEKNIFRTYNNIKNLRMEWDNEYFPELPEEPDLYDTIGDGGK